MEVEKKKDNRMYITERTPSCRDFEAKAKKLYRELLKFVKKSPVLNSMYEINIAKQKEKEKIKNKS